MAASVLTATADVYGIDETLRNFIVRGTIAVAAGDYSTAGNTLDLSGLGVPSGVVPYVRIWSKLTPGAANLFIYSFAPGTTTANGKMQVFTGAAAQTALTELSAGAMPAGVTGDTIAFEAIFQKFQP